MALPLFLHGSQIRYSPVGHAQATVGSAATGLPGLGSINKERVTRVIIRNLGDPIRWRDDGIAPTGAVGFKNLADEVFVYDGVDLAAFSMIRAADALADVEVNVIYYGL